MRKWKKRQKILCLTINSALIVNFSLRGQVVQLRICNKHQKHYKDKVCLILNKF